MGDFVRVATVGELPDPGATVVEVDGDVIALFHVEGAYHALDDVCTHDGGPLASGELTGHKVVCPRHGAKFDIRTGAALSMPAVRATRAHDVKVEDGGVWVRLRSGHGVDGPVAQSPVAQSPVAKPATGLPIAPPPAAVPASTGVVAVPASTGVVAVPASTGVVATAPSVTAAGALCEDSVRELLKQVKDPELFVNIVDLGLIYGVTLTPSTETPGKQQVSVDMTMTSPACPAGPQLIGDTKRTVAAHPEVAGVEVRIVMEPPWTPDRMTDDARDQLGIF
jgi:metal-sulfur cluster biosynthetic enzyme/nitrite reductase/ring-hydroxylating ferredoxin subunit